MARRIQVCPTDPRSSSGSYLIPRKGVAYATPESDDLPIDQITLLDDWGPRMGNHKKIPSVISFSPSTELDEQQWGIDLSDNAVAMVYTKMELESRSVLSELDLAVRALEGMKNL